MKTSFFGCARIHAWSRSWLALPGEKQHSSKTVKLRQRFAYTCICFSYFSMTFWTPKRGRQVPEICTGVGQTHVTFSCFLNMLLFHLAGPVRIQFRSEFVRTRKDCFPFNSVRPATELLLSRGSPNWAFLINRSKTQIDIHQTLKIIWFLIIKCVDPTCRQ